MKKSKSIKNSILISEMAKIVYFAIDGLNPAESISLTDLSSKIGISDNCALDALAELVRHGFLKLPGNNQAVVAPIHQPVMRAKRRALTF